MPPARLADKLPVSHPPARRDPALGAVSLPPGVQGFPVVSPGVFLSADYAEHCFLCLLAVQIVAFVKGLSVSLLMTHFPVYLFIIFYPFGLPF